MPQEWRASRANSIAGGPYNITASIGAAAASFTLTNQAGSAATVNASAGSGQSTSVITAFPIALQATVRDAGNNLVPGVTVTFTAPGTGASGTFSGMLTATAQTNSSGIATAPTFTANSTVGSYAVTASVAGASAASFTLTNSALTVRVTLLTSPANLQVSIDGGTYHAAPLVQSLTVGSTHTIAVQATQAGATGTQYVFANWSDSGAASHSVTTPFSATTYTATFATQHYLTTATNPAAGGSISPASGWYNSGAVVSVSAAANTGYQFSNFSGDLTATSSPQSLTMNSAKSTTANSSTGGTTWYSTGGTWTNRRQITVNANKVSGGSASNFPVLVSITYPDLKLTTNGGKVTQSNGADIVFTDGSGTQKLDFELDTYSASTGTLVAWVRVPTLSNGSTLYLYYGNASVTTSQANPTGVWNSIYAGVWHMGDGTTLNTNDSTGHFNGTQNSVSAAGGQIGGAASFSSVFSDIDVGGGPSGGSCPSNGLNTGTFTYEGWINTSTSTPFFGTTLTGTPNLPLSSMGVAELSTTQSLPGEFVQSSSSITSGSWNHVAVTYNSLGNYAPGEYEFEMPYGVRVELQERIVAVGEQLRLYVPYGAHWWPYTVRRIGENPRNLVFVWRALAGSHG